MLEQNERTIKEFLTHLARGKPIANKKRKPVKEQTLKKYQYWLSVIEQHMQKDFKQLVEADIDLFRDKLREDKILNRSGQVYKPSVKRDIEYKILGCFLKWLEKGNLMNYSDNYNEETEISALSRNEVNQLIEASSLKDQIIIQLLFDGGFRIGELIKITFEDVKCEDRESKGYYKIRIRESKTKKRTVPVNFCTDLLDAWLKFHSDKEGSSQQLIQRKEAATRVMLKRLGYKVLKKNVYPHLLRHSSATFFCKKMRPYVFCKKYGWSMNSDMPKRYIDREGLELDEVGDHAEAEIKQSYSKELNQVKEQALMNVQQMENQMKHLINVLIEEKIIDKNKLNASNITKTVMTLSQE